MIEDPKKFIDDTSGIIKNTTATGAIAPDSSSKEGILKNALPLANKTLRTLTLGQPLLGAALFAGGLGLLGHRYGPMLDRLLSPRFGGTKDKLDRVSEDEIRERRKTWGLTLAGLGGLGFLSTQISTKAPGLGLFSYKPMGKTASGSVYNTLSLQDSRDIILQNNSLSLDAKQDALALLRTFDGPPSKQIGGGDIVGQAVSTGISGATGAAIGFVTAKALGLPNPSSTAILGAVTSVLGVRPALVGSVVFGH